jgi:hypothetical protein
MDFRMFRGGWGSCKKTSPSLKWKERKRQDEEGGRKHEYENSHWTGEIANFS